MAEIDLPYQWRPREYQEPAWAALESGVKRLCLVWHRRAGKDLFAINWIAPAAFRRVGLYWHMLPTYSQGRKVVWEGSTRDGRAFLDHFPGYDDPGPDRVVVRKRDEQMALTLHNGSRYQVVGADDPDRLVGSNPIGVVFSEWSVMNPDIWGFIQPILAENGGWAVFIFTPRGRNHGWRTYDRSLTNPKWFTQKLAVSDTYKIDEQGARVHAISEEAIQEARDEGMSDAMVQQEFYVSFDAALEGSYYGDLMAKMLNEGRIMKVPHDPNYPVTTAWDLGMADAMSIWFIQCIGGQHRAIDYYWGSGVGIEHYVKFLKEKPYVYNDHIVPHDAKVRELGAGVERIESARLLGLVLRVLPKYGIKDGIDAVRRILPNCVMDKVKCESGIEGMRQYKKKKVSDQQGPEGQAVYADAPLHSWASNPADAFRQYAMGKRVMIEAPKILYPPRGIV